MRYNNDMCMWVPRTGMLMCICPFYFDWGGVKHEE